MSITTTDTQGISNEPVTLAEAKVQLGVTDNLRNDDITRFILIAREEAEGYSARTLRLTVTHFRTYDGWPSRMRFDTPPLIAVVAVTYFDADNETQTWASSNYTVQTPTDGRGQLTWSRAPNAPAFPLLFDRIDNVKVEYTSGCVTANQCPERAKGAILMLVSALYDSSEFKEAEAYRMGAKMLLSGIDWGNYE